MAATTYRQATNHMRRQNGPSVEASLAAQLIKASTTESRGRTVDAFYAGAPPSACDWGAAEAQTGFS